ncbi:MAG: carboxypeptidase regulatory-like domain-containing protein, partial [Planctomycetaceae bacterium]|nr:carboxypeptidase regulatory-like domain-containing protein [Planctomycetaceae bacterium]
PTLTTTCEADGSFRFDGLPKGLYWLSINSKFGDEKKAVAVGERESATVELSAAQIPEAKETTAINESGPTGTLTGRFVWEGRRPRLPLLVTPNKDYPGGVADESLQIGKDGGVAGVVVWLSDKEFPAVTPPPGKPEKLVMGKSGFQPRVLAFHAPHELTIFQQMTEVSNARYEGFRKSFNVQLNPKTFRTVDVAPERLPMLIHSDIHPWMSGYLFPVEHPYFAVTAADGSFQIPDIPVGEWNFSVWHERSGYLRWDDFDGRRHPIKIEKGANSLPERKLNAEQLHVDMKSMADDVTNRTHWGVGERVTGRVVDHVGKPVPKARVLLVGDAIVHVDLQADREKLGWERDQPGHVDSTLTDADGAFSLDRSNKPGTRMVIISEDLALWSLPAWEFPDSGAITLPEPGTLTVDLNLPGDSPKASFSLEQVDGPWDYVSSGTGTSSSSWRAGWAISNPGSVRIEHLPPGRYLVKRRDVVRMSEKRLIVSEAEETLIELSPGDSKLVSFDRQTGLPVSGTVTDVPAEYLPETVVRAAMRSVHLVDRRFDQAFTNTIEQVVVDDQGRFTFDRLPA